MTTGATLVPRQMSPADLLRLSSAGLRTLLIVHRHAQQLKAEITLVGLSEEVSFVMSATGFLDFFRIAEDLDAELERAGR